MAEKSYFFNDVNDDRVYLAEDFAMFFSTLIANGVFPNPSTNLQVLANEETPMAITIKPGKAWINGYLYWNPDNLVKNLESAYTNPRIDRVVIRWVSNSREIKAYVLTGIPGAVPVAPELTRNSDVWELAIADIWVGANVTTITQANITDTRLSNDLCGIVHALVQQVDVTTIFNQYQAWYLETVNDATTDIATMLSAFQSSFNAWFASIQDILDENTAGNLLNMINDLIERMNIAETAIGQNASSIATNTADIAELDGRMDKQERILTATISTTWTGSAAPYAQTINIGGVTANDKPVITPVYSATLATAVLEKESWNMVSKIETGAGTVTATCFSDKPTTSINIQLKGV